MGITSPTTDGSQPMASSFCISRGSTVSEEVVAATISSSSRMAPISRKMFTPARQAISPSTTITKTRQTA